MFPCGLWLQYITCKTNHFCGLRPLFIYAMSVKEWQSSRLPSYNSLFIHHWFMCKAVYAPPCVCVYTHWNIFVSHMCLCAFIHQQQQAVESCYCDLWLPSSVRQQVSVCVCVSVPAYMCVCKLNRSGVRVSKGSQCHGPEMDFSWGIR